MLLVNQHKDILLEEFYLDSDQNVRRKKDGYLNRFKAGDLANFFEGTGGYMAIQLPKQRTMIKRSHLVVLLSGIDIPDDKEVDHIDGNRKNDHPTNLRIVNRRRNSCNRKKRSDNSSGVTGIRWSEYHQHFVIRRTVNGVRYSRSRKTMEQALEALKELTSMDTEYTERHGK